MKTILFPGQGSQAKGMGKLLFDKYKDLTAQADSLLGYSIKDLCLNDPRRELNQTRFTQPALYVLNALSYLDRIEQCGKPDFLAGHSLGELNALLAADCFDFETGLKLVQKRGELMSQAAEGAMAAILNSSEQEIRAILADNHLDQIDIANFNAPSQIVISGSKAQIATAQDYFQQGNAKYIPLNTSGAFHSRLMAPTREQFESFLKLFDFRPPKIAVISNVTARPYEGADVVANLSRQITGSVRWTETIQYLLSPDLLSPAAGERSVAPMEFIEVGHGDVLTKLVHKIRMDSPEATPPAAASEPSSHQARAQERVHLWNEKYPVGTRVKSAVVRGEVLETRTEAVILFQHRAAVYLKGYNGYFDLEELVPV